MSALCSHIQLSSFTFNLLQKKKMSMSFSNFLRCHHLFGAYLVSLVGLALSLVHPSADVGSNKCCYLLKSLALDFLVMLTSDS